MRAVDRLCFAWSAVSGQRLRSGLTVLGIAVGILAVVLLTAVGEGVRRFVLGEFTQFGTNIVGVQPGKNTTFGMSGATISSVRPLTVDDAAALTRVPAVTAVVPVIQGNAEVESGARARRTTVFGVGADMPAVWRMTVASGSFLPDDGFTNARPFVVLGQRMYRELYGDDNALGERVRIGNDRFRVIGVMASKGQMLGFDLDDTVFIPVGRATEMFDREGVMEIDVTYAEDEPSAQVVRDIERLLLARHGQVDFTLITQDKMLDVLGDILDILTAGVAAIGAISLVVGAFGIATIMTIAVSERTAEVGLLRALGARRSDILRIFLVESAVLGAAGGAVGVAVALALVGAARTLVPGLPLAVLWPFVGGALVVSIVIGIGAGLLPAARAARLDPVEALRAE
ncbi:MAG: ABC transporter permease [Gammaproteobacteria bacterium]|nr:ABC transporter permease [Gammaproteobacteria bacterium]MCP5201072.1 ABC transporter permease [Gammaproteobacteria bacterium]